MDTSSLQLDYSLRFGHLEHEHLIFLLSLSEVARNRNGSGSGLHPTVHIQAGGFTGQVPVFCDLDDFAALLTEAESLYLDLTGSAAFGTMESQVGFNMRGDGRGHILLDGFLNDRRGDGNTLEFRLEFDQTLLRESVTGLRRLIVGEM